VITVLVAFAVTKTVVEEHIVVMQAVVTEALPVEPTVTDIVVQIVTSLQTSVSLLFSNPHVEDARIISGAVNLFLLNGRYCKKETGSFGSLCRVSWTSRCSTRYPGNLVSQPTFGTYRITVRAIDVADLNCQLERL
jgi:hypothetical protein